MTEKLTDPSKPAHEIIKVLEDGGAMRNDGVRLQAANKNPWYVLATIYGEQPEGGFDDELAAKNRRAWNGWFCGDLNEGERADRAQKTGLMPDDLKPLSKDELDEIKKRFAARMGKGAGFPTKNETIDFSNTYFSRLVDFNKTVFEKDTYFGSAVFAGFTQFDFAAFKGVAYFDFAVFKSTAHFNSATFTGFASFYSVTFTQLTSFLSAAFTGHAYFSSAKFQWVTQFDGAKFLTYVPEFHAAELYDDTVFPIPDNYTDNWPPLKGKDVMPAAGQKRAYNRLRLFMNRSLQIEEEQFFHRQEMRCKTRLARWYHKPFYWLYAWLSDYGNSVWRPMVGIIAVMLFGAAFMLWWQEAFTFLPKESTGFDWTMGLLGEDDPWAKPRQAAGWSISNTLPFLGFGKLYYGELAKELAWPLKVAGGVQTLLGYVLLFFLGLGLRNRFRLR